MRGGCSWVVGMALLAAGCDVQAPWPVSALSGLNPLGSSSEDDAPVRGLLYSPNAEPLSGGPLGQPKCPDALAAWLGRIDTNHDGVIDRDEFLADARAQFARMDLDHDGFITADEVSTYRMPFLATATAPAAKPQGDHQAGDHHAERNGGRGRAVSSDTGDPVMSADSNLDFKVSLAEFTAQAEEILAKLDSDHDRRLTRAEIEQTCPKP